MVTRLIVGMVLMAFVASGCSISASSASLSKSSDSSSDSSKSSSGSSGGGADEEDTAYRDDVRDETVLYVTSNDDLETFQTTLTDVARRHGIVDWEAAQATYVGIGQGLAEARVRGDDLTSMEERLAGSDAERRSALRTGYESASR